MNYIGWDAGGAHLKVARLSGNGQIDMAAQFAAPIWQGYGKLESALAEACASLGISNALHAVTMTAELADIFENRNEGMAKVINTFHNRFGKELLVYAGRNGLVEAGRAHEYFSDIASANWHAAAQYVANQLEAGLLIDAGSTTTDITGFHCGKITNRGYSDQERLQNDELLYTGIIRTPVMAITDSAPFAGTWQTLAAEHFATCADIYRVTGELDERDDLLSAADAGEKSIGGSVRRLARMLGRDCGDTTDRRAWIVLARYLSERQLQKISKGLFRILSCRPELVNSVIVGAGCGRFLIKRLARRMQLPYRDFAEFVKGASGLQESACLCAPAVAVAHLARDNSA